MFEAMRKSIARRARNQKAPYACIEAVEAAATHAVRRGLRVRAQAVRRAGRIPTRRKALRYAFFAEREVAKLPDIPARHAAAPDRQAAAVVGAGTMGGGIAMSFADFGFPT